MKNIRIYTGILLTAVMIMTLSVSVFAQSNREQNYGVSQVSSSSVHASDKKNNIIFEKKIKVKKVDSVAKAGDFTSAELAKYISLSAAALLCIIWLIVRCLKKKSGRVFAGHTICTVVCPFFIHRKVRPME